MKKEELYNIVRISIAIAFVIALAYIVCVSQPFSFSFSNIIRGISMGITIALLFWAAYFKWLWKIPLVKYIVKRQNLNGTWEGILISDWKNEFGKSVPPKEIFLVVRQNFLNIHFTSFTNNYIGTSYVEAILYDEEKGINKVIYIYRKETSDIGQQENNEGTTELRVLTSEEPKMEGKYWTNIKTCGIIKLRKLTAKHIETFEEGLKIKQK